MGDQKCKSPEEIKKYINRIRVDTWANFYETDFLIQKGTPAARIEKWLKNDVLESTHNFQNWITIEENEI